MITMLTKSEIIHLKLEGWSNSEIHRTFGVSRNTVKKYWTEYQTGLSKLLGEDPSVDPHKIVEEIVSPPHYDSSSRGWRRYNTEIDALIDQILEDEKRKAELLGPNKQALTKHQIYELVKEAGHDIGETTVRNKIREKLNKHKECFIRQEYEYGDRFEYDFGEVKLVIDHKRVRGYLAVLTCPASGFRWAYLYRDSKMAVFLDSQTRFFEMLGGSFKEGVYDNMRNVVKRFIGRSEKEINDQLLGFSAYYGFRINVTNCFSGNEKGSVEESVKYIRNKVYAAKYIFSSFEEAQEYLQEKLSDLNKDKTIEEEKKHLSAYRPRYEVARIESCHVNKYSFIQIDTNFYSVPDSLVDKYVTAKIYPDEIVVYYKEEQIATHRRSPNKKETCVDIRHYLNTFLKKPGALRNSTALKSVPELKSLFDTYFKENPRYFIDLLKDKRDCSIEEIILRIKEEVCLIPQEENWISQACEDQIAEISRLFIGGEEKNAEYIH